MSEKLQTLAVHAGCVLVICVCFALAELTVLRTTLVLEFSGLQVPVLARALEVSGFFLWGKLGFKPAEVVMDKLLAGMDTARVVRVLSQRPPAAPGIAPKPPVAPPPAGG